MGSDRFVIQIARRCNPHILLCLSRTSKCLRELLMTKRAEPLWRAAGKNVGIPWDWPTMPSSPQLASFLFDTHCMVNDPYTNLAIL